MALGVALCAGLAHAQPAMDRTEVTIGAFRAFVQATGRVTQAERDGGGRGFGFTGGHFHQGWGNPDQRKLVLNAILWTAQAEVPEAGVDSVVGEADLSANLDPKPGQGLPEKPRRQ